MDCGATNVRAIAISEKGQMLGMHSVSNNTQPDPHHANGLIWDVEEIWAKLVTCTREVLKKVDASTIAGVTVTTFGVNGAPMDKSGKLLYPVISWQCGRTASVMDNIGKYIPLEKLYGINGLQPFSFNTINVLIWLKENRPEILEKMDHFVFIPSIFLHKLTGNFCTDTTMAGTSMLTDLRTRRFSTDIMQAIGVDKNKFAPFAEAGEMIGKITAHASTETGLTIGTPVMATGHDTQFAIFGSGADENVPVLSTGTWEILMVRSKNFSTEKNLLNAGITTELDPQPGIVNMGVQWIGSGLLEWVKKTLYAAEANNENIYDIMIGDAEKVAACSEGVRVNPSFLLDGNNTSKGSINGINLYTKREQIYRAALESLAAKVKINLELLENAGGFTSKSLIVVGGGSKNRLWNQLRADMLGISIKLVDQKETTVLGAALFAMAGAGMYKTADEARAVVNYNAQMIEPKNKMEVYNPIYDFIKNN